MPNFAALQGPEREVHFTTLTAAVEFEQTDEFLYIAWLFFV